MASFLPLEFIFSSLRDMVINQEKLIINQQLTCSDDVVSDNSLKINHSVQGPISNSVHDTDENVFLTSSPNSQLYVPPLMNVGVQLVDSSTSSVRRGLSVASDDGDFQMVRYKKTKSLNIHGDNIKRPHVIHSQQDTNMDIDKEGANINHPTSNFAISNENNLIGNDQQRFSASARYALTRFPFPPVIVRFNIKKISISLFKSDIIKHFKLNHDFDIEIVNCRLSSVKCSNNEVDVLLYVKDSYSFALLLDHSKWPSTICGEVFVFPSTPPIPPQLSLIIKNVDLRLDFDEFTKEIMNVNPHVKRVIRMKNKFGNCIKLVKLELTSPKARDELLKVKKLCINYMCYEVDEYLSPINVLICSKCCGLGHFRRQCTEQDETCKTCGQSSNDLKSHLCVGAPR